MNRRNVLRASLTNTVKVRMGPLVASRQPQRTDIPCEHWGLARGENGRLWFRDIDLHLFAEEHGTPLFLVDGERLDSAAEAALAPVRAGCGADIFYSYKTNPVPEVLRRLHDRGIGAEVISAYELWLAFELGVEPDRIVYNGPAKSADSLRIAIERQVRLINANSAAEADRIASLARHIGTPVNLGLRATMPGMWGGQFGISTTSPELRSAIRSVIDEPAVNLIGLHLHRGGVIRTPAEWRSYVGSVLHLCDELHGDTGWTPMVLDLGGSLPCATVAAIAHREFRLNRAVGSDLLPPDISEAISVSQASEMAYVQVVDHFRSRGWPIPDIIQEPGRALTSDSQMLLLTVVDIKHDQPPTHAVLDGGRNIADPLPHEYHQLFNVSSPRTDQSHVYRIVGPICTPADVLYYSWALPTLKVGDVLAVMDTGAYFVPFSTSFSFPQPPILEYGDSVRYIRRREEFSDIVGRDVISRDVS